MKGLKAKDKNVRMRVCQLIAESISAIQDIEWVVEACSAGNMGSSP